LDKESRGFALAVGFAHMDVWLAVIGSGDPDESVIGAYSSEELAATIAERASPGDWHTTSVALDKVPEWIDELEAAEERALLRNRPIADAIGPEIAERGARAWPDV
jgi:hypothetical protein